MEKRPFVSVVILTYNKKETLKRCIDSVLGQTYRDFEIIIVDDCSVDGTMEFVETEYGAITEINILYVRNDNNLGAGASRNVGVSYASGDYIAFHDSDDVWLPNKLEKQIEHFSRCSQEVGAVYCPLYTNGMDSAIYPPEKMNIILKSGYVFYTLLLNSLVGMSTLVIKKNVFAEIGGFNEQLNALEEYELTIRIAQKYAIMLVNDVLAVAYESKNSCEKNLKDKIITHCYIMNLYSNELTLSGLKRKKFETVYQDAVSYQCEVFFCQCIMQLSKDQDYLSYVQEKWEELYPSSHPEIISTPNISGIMACTGCMACYNVCPVDAISQGYNEEGFLIPIIDDSRCIQCGQCISVCPVCNETQGAVLPRECYAVMGANEIRKKSSSGGVFRILADRILEEDGFVCGAVWDDDWQVIHMVSDKVEDVERMMSSKYIQSNIEDVYSKIKVLLDEGKKVLFTGCACQTAGLKRYLAREYDSLLLVDVVCHGVPSQKVFDAAVGEKSEIAEISFRKKQIYGWDTGLYLKYRNGTEHIGSKKEPYMSGFLKNWTLRKTCYNCKFKNKKYSDLSLGDFWGINYILEFEDRLGTSFVTLNTAKGAHFFKEVLPQFQNIVRLQTELAEGFNPCISKPVAEPKCRELLFEEWKRNNNRTLTDMMQTVRKRIHFDIALVYMWGINYGNALTNYALHTFLQIYGKKIVVLDNYCKLEPVNQFKKFAEEHYILSSSYFSNHDYEMLNECCDVFVVGSDQTWNHRAADYYFYGNYFLLDFVADDKKKVSYAASFGAASAAVQPEIGKRFYHRFQAISVREDFGINVCRDRYGVEAEQVLDPVFLLDKEDYDTLLHEVSNVEQKPYIAVYFLNPTEEKRELSLQIQQMLGDIKIVNMMDANLRNMDYYFRVLEYDNIKTELTVVEWLSYIRNADFVITDSYHGMCLSMIFEKNFIAVRNRQSARFNTFIQYPEIRSRIIGENAQCDVMALKDDINYESVKKSLSIEIEKSKLFIRENIL